MVDDHRAAAPEIATGWLTVGGPDLPKAIAEVAAGGHRAIHVYEVSVTPETVVHAHELGLWVVVWTVDDVARACGLAEMGIAAIVTNAPFDVREALTWNARPL